MTDYVTLDQMIATLQAKKDAGMPGSTPVGIESRDNNGKAGMVKLDIATRIVPVAKDDFEKGWTLCRVVSRGGVTSLVIG